MEVIINTRVAEGGCSSGRLPSYEETLTNSKPISCKETAATSTPDTGNDGRTMNFILSFKTHMTRRDIIKIAHSQLSGAPKQVPDSWLSNGRNYKIECSKDYPRLLISITGTTVLPKYYGESPSERPIVTPELTGYAPSCWCLSSEYTTQVMRNVLDGNPTVSFQQFLTATLDLAAAVVMGPLLCFLRVPESTASYEDDHTQHITCTVCQCCIRVRAGRVNPSSEDAWLEVVRTIDAGPCLGLCSDHFC